MCGIIAIIGQQAVDNRLVEGLRRLEYRGYDSAGIATLENGVVHRCRAEGKLDRLAQRLSAGGLAGSVGIGHTRWATHGAPTESNAHPHLAGRVAIVHNGIIENHRALRTELESLGCRFATDTDSEVIAHLIDTEIAAGRSPRDAVLAAVRRLRGAYALAVLFAGEGDLLIGARRGSPLAVGFGEGETFLGSDALALAPLTRRLSYLEDGDVVVLTRAGAAFFDAEGNPVTRAESGSAAAVAPATKGEYRHFMLKEIHDQPVALAETLRAYMDPAHRRIILPDLPFDLAAVP
ncbi:MAG: glutamine--fructose-6-phosphate aminotransferase, partial [Alphaproteobacteria bacterium]